MPVVLVAVASKFSQVLLLRCFSMLRVAIARKKALWSLGPFSRSINSCMRRRRMWLRGNLSSTSSRSRKESIWMIKELIGLTFRKFHMDTQMILIKFKKLVWSLAQMALRFPRIRISKIFDQILTIKEKKPCSNRRNKRFNWTSQTLVACPRSIKLSLKRLSNSKFQKLSRASALSHKSPWAYSTTQSRSKRSLNRKTKRTASSKISNGTYQRGM